MNSAINYILKLLSKRDYTTAEIKKKLSMRDIPAMEQEEIVGFLEKKGFIDDFRYANNFVTTHTTRGDVRIRYELLRKGISREIISQALLNIDKSALLDRAKGVAESYLSKGNRNGIGREDLRNKIFAKLARQGFTYEIIRQVSEELKI